MGKTSAKPGTLYLVATPIGNLADMSFRAIETLAAVDVIACEDTRHSRKLLDHHGITGKLVSYHAHNERERAAEFAKLLREGRSIAVISDAGTPGINDPGVAVVRSAIERGFSVVAIPGPVAFVSAAIVSGLPTDSIFFGGFLPSRSGERRRRLLEVKEIPATLVFYESPHRLSSSLSDCLEILGPRRAAVARELTKIHEETLRGTLDELAKIFAGASPKGEFVLVIDKGDGIDFRTAGISIADRVSQLEAAGVDHKEALKAAAKELGISRSEAYRRLQELGR